MSTTNRPPFPDELTDALRDDPERELAMRRIWDALEAPSGAPAPPRDKAWDELVKRLPAGRPIEAAPDRPARARRRTAWHWVPIGAGVVAMLIITYLWARPDVVHAPPGGRETVTLADGTTIELNSDSRLTLNRRNARLEGEAFFDVHPDAARPFVVTTHNGRIEVLGTRFNVRAREGTSGFETVVTLAEGRVGVASMGSQSRLVLDSVGAAATLRADMPPVASTEGAELDRVTAWRSHGFAVVNEPIRDILAEVQRRYAVHLELESGLETTAPMTLFYLRGTSPEQIIHDVCLSRGWKYRPTSRGFYLFAAAPASDDEAIGS